MRYKVLADLDDRHCRHSVRIVNAFDSVLIVACLKDALECDSLLFACFLVTDTDSGCRCGGWQTRRRNGRHADVADVAGRFGMRFCRFIGGWTVVA